MKNGTRTSTFVTLQTSNEGIYLGPAMAPNYCKPLENIHAHIGEPGSFVEVSFFAGQVYACGPLTPGTSLVAIYKNGPSNHPIYAEVSRLSFLADGAILPEPPFAQFQSVYYVPPHCDGNHEHPDAEPGTVTKVQLNSSGSYSVWVSFHSGDTAALTPLKNLKKREHFV